MKFRIFSPESYMVWGIFLCDLGRGEKKNAAPDGVEYGLLNHVNLNRSLELNY